MREREEDMEFEDVVFKFDVLNFIKLYLESGQALLIEPALDSNVGKTQENVRFQM